MPIKLCPLLLLQTVLHTALLDHSVVSKLSTFCILSDIFDKSVSFKITGWPMQREYSFHPTHSFCMGEAWCCICSYIDANLIKNQIHVLLQMQLQR